MATSKTAADPAWKLKEQVVALLEKTITPAAEVQHNQRLPDITTGEKRQCDVIVKYGRAPREHLAIVEVQDRDDRLDIAAIRELLAKDAFGGRAKPNLRLA
jgi:hypothetical protein